MDVPLLLFPWAKTQVPQPPSYQPTHHVLLYIMYREHHVVIPDEITCQAHIAIAIASYD